MEGKSDSRGIATILAGLSYIPWARGISVDNKRSFQAELGYGCVSCTHKLIIYNSFRLDMLETTVATIASCTILVPSGDVCVSPMHWLINTPQLPIFFQFLPSSSLVKNVFVSSNGAEDDSEKR